jgi:hypothetical protein
MLPSPRPVSYGKEREERRARELLQMQQAYNDGQQQEQQETGRPVAPPVVQLRPPA